MRRLARLAPFLVVLAVPLALLQVPPVRRGVFALLEYMRVSGPPGVLAYFAVYGAAAVIAAPVAVFSAMAGYAYGPLHGVLVASPASVLAAACAFLVGRTAARGWLTRRAGHHPRWRAIQRAVHADAFRVALLLRLTPLVPQNFLSYGLALTGVTLRQYLAATFLGLLPITCLHVYVGSLARDASSLLSGETAPPGPWRWISLGAGLAVSIVTFVLTARHARRALDRVLVEPPEPPPA